MNLCISSPKYVSQPPHPAAFHGTCFSVSPAGGHFYTSHSTSVCSIMQLPHQADRVEKTSFISTNQLQ